MELSGPFAALGAKLVELLVQIAGVVVMVVLGWKFIKFMFSGGEGRALTNLLISVVSIGVVMAALSNLSMTAGIILGLGNAILTAVAESVRGAF